MSDAPYRVETYCGCCHDTRPHYLRVDHCDAKRDCYECAGCLHLVFVAVKDCLTTGGAE